VCVCVPLQGIEEIRLQSHDPQKMARLYSRILDMPMKGVCVYQTCSLLIASQITQATNLRRNTPPPTHRLRNLINTTTTPHTHTHSSRFLVGQCSRLSRIAQRSCAGKAIPVQRSCAASTFWRVQIGSTSQISIKTAPVLTLDVHVSMDSRIIIPRDPRRPQVTPEPRVPFSLMQMGSNHKSQREEWVPRTF